MDADSFDKLPKTADGMPVVKVMTDPDMGDNGDDGYLSLVTRGANGRRIAVAKIADNGSVPDDTELPGTTLDLGQAPGWMAMWRQFMGGLFGTPVAKPTTKAALTFDEALVVPLVFDRVWDGFDALLDSIHSTMRDEDVGDKRAAIAAALQSYAAYVIDAFEGVPVVKGDQAAAVRKMTDQVLAENPRGVINGADKATITAAQEAVAKVAAALAPLTGDAQPSTPAPPAPTPDEDQPMTPEQIEQVAEIAAKSARKAAQKSNPEATAAQLDEIAQSARMQVLKFAVMGPAQPGIPTTVLQDQIGESAGMSGKAKDPSAQIMSAINSVRDTVAKLAGGIGIDLETGDVAELNEDGSNAGLAHVVAKQGESLATVSESVRKMAGTPAAPRGSGDPSEGNPPEPERARKADDDTFKGTALSFGD